MACPAPHRHDASNDSCRRRPPARRPPGAAHRRLPRNLAQRRAGSQRIRKRRRTNGADLRQGLPAAQVQDRPGPAGRQLHRRVRPGPRPAGHRRGRPDRRLQRAGRRRHGHDARQRQHLPATSPSPICYVPAGQVVAAAEAVVKLVPRPRQPRRPQAGRASSTSSTTGASRSSARCWPATSAVPLTLPRPVEVTGFDLHLGWHAQGDGKWFYGSERRERPRQGRGRLPPAHRPAAARRALQRRPPPDADAGRAPVRPAGERPHDLEIEARCVDHGIRLPEDASR